MPQVALDGAAIALALAGEGAYVAINWLDNQADAEAVARGVREKGRRAALVRADVAKLDIDQNPETAAAYGIRSIPAVLIFRGGQEVDRIVGLQPRARYERALEAAGATP